MKEFVKGIKIRHILGLVLLVALILLAISYGPELLWKPKEKAQEISEAVKGDIAKLQEKAASAETSARKAFEERNREKAGREVAEQKAVDAEEKLKKAEEALAASKKLKPKSPAVLSSPIASAQAAVPGKPNMFGGKEECLAALRSGDYDPYVPKFYSRRGVNPPDGVTRVQQPLESDACVHLLTVAGMRWVVQKKGEVYRFHAVGGKPTSTKPYARDDCGNPADDIAYLAGEGALTPKPVVTLTADPKYVEYGGETELVWASENTTSCFARDGWSGTRTTSGNQVVRNLTATRNFRLACVGPGGEASDTARVVVAPRPRADVDDGWKTTERHAVAPPQQETIVVVQQQPQLVIVQQAQPQVMYAGPQAVYAAPSYGYAPAVVPVYGGGGGSFALAIDASRRTRTVTQTITQTGTTPGTVIGGPPVITAPRFVTGGGPPIITGPGGGLAGAGIPRFR